jgi:hypothetical protein
MGRHFETVYTVEDYYDGPRSGVADFNGQPHFYRSVYLDTDQWDADEDRFELTPIRPEIRDLAVEDFALWQRWQVAELAGGAPPLAENAERVLPEDARGEFRAGDRVGLRPGELGSLAVRWTPVE